LGGWKRYTELVKGEVVPTLNVKEDKIEFNPINEILVYDYDNEIYHIKNSHLDFIVTPEHRMVLNISKAKQEGYKRQDEWTGWKLLRCRVIPRMKS
jgi:hypothetical protein